MVPEEAPTGGGGPREEDRRWQVFRWLGETMSGSSAWTDPPLDWSEVWEYVPGDVLPMLAHRMTESSISPLPDEVEEQFRLTRRAAMMRTIMVRSALAAVDGCLASTEIRYVWLKGAALRSQVYPNPALRPMEDLDVWVPADLVPAAVASVESIGYRDDGWVKLAEEASGFPTARLISESFPRVPLEIHGLPNSLRALPHASLEGLWERSAPLEGTHGLALSPADTILHLCLHLSRHHRFALGLRPLLDISLSVSAWKDVIDWSAWCDEVHAAKAGASVWLPLTLSSSIFRASVPQSALDSLRPDSAADDLVALAKEQFEDTREMPNALERLVGGRPTGADAVVVSAPSRAIKALPHKIRHYITRIRFGQIPVSGWRRVVRLAQGRRHLTDALRERDGDGSEQVGPPT